MTSTSGDRSAFFPAIEKKHGQPVSHWLKLLTPLKGRPYAEQMALLQGEHGFSRTHANALVMHFRGSTTSRRFDDPEGYFATLTAAQASAMRAVFAAITKKYRHLDMVVAWNKPILKSGEHYVFAAPAATRHLTLNPWSNAVLDACRPSMTDLVVSKHTFQVPLDWKIDTRLLQHMVAARLAEIDQ